MSLKRQLAVFLTLICLTACGEESLHQGLTEKQANEISNLLRRHSIEPTKVLVEGTGGQESSFTIQVSKEDLAKASQLLQDHNLPRPKVPTFEDICGEEAPLIPTPEFAKCQSIVALKGAITKSLMSINGVIDVNVVLNLPEKKAFDTQEGEDPRPTASAVLKLNRMLLDKSLKEAQFQRFIANSVENLDPRDVTVILTYQESFEPVAGSKTADSAEITGGPVPAGSDGASVGEGEASAGLTEVAGLELSEVSVKRFKLYAIGFLVLLMGVSAALIINVLKMTKVRQELKVAKGLGGSGGDTPLLESPPPTPALPEGEGEASPPEANPEAG